MNTARIAHAPATTDLANNDGAPSRESAPSGLEALLQRSDLWRGRDAAPRTDAVATGHAPLDAALPGGGWPNGALTEILHEQEGGGELQLLMPALANLSQGKRWIVWVGMPHLPYAPAIAASGVNLAHLLLVQPRTARDRLWTLEQSLRSGACAAAVGWSLDSTDERALRRLQLAAEEGRALGFLFRPAHVARQGSPAALRLRVEPGATGPVVHVLKCRGGWTRGPVRLHAVA
jgi:hypothetical protein